jgi:hypothetical protein
VTCQLHDQPQPLIGGYTVHTFLSHQAAAAIHMGHVFSLLWLDSMLETPPTRFSGVAEKILLCYRWEAIFLLHYFSVLDSKTIVVG